MNLEQLGWNSFFSDAFRSFAGQGYHPGRVCRAARGRYSLLTAQGEIEASARGKLQSGRDLEVAAAVVGDWTAFSEIDARIEAVLARRTKISRKAAGRRTQEQVLAANVDVLLLVSGLDHDFNLRRLERCLALASDSGVRPVLVLNKSDLCEDAGKVLREVRPVAAGAPVVLISALEGIGVDDLESYLRPGETAALIGSSGAGKSTLANRLLGFESQPVREVRSHDGRGRHTTTARELLLMPHGWLLLDMPGLREVQLWGDAEGVDQAFPEIASLAASCRFRDCRHQGEPGCAVAAAVEMGEMGEGRLQNYHKLQRELAYLDTKQDERAALEQKRKWKQIQKTYRRTHRPKG
jgi:ribosome biogenesis GTPase